MQNSARDPKRQRDFVLSFDPACQRNRYARLAPFEHASDDVLDLLELVRDGGQRGPLSAWPRGEEPLLVTLGRKSIVVRPRDTADICTGRD